MYYETDNEPGEEKTEAYASEIISNENNLNKVDKVDGELDDVYSRDISEGVPELIPLTDSVKAVLVDDDLISDDEDDEATSKHALSGYSAVETSNI